MRALSCFMSGQIGATSEDMTVGGAPEAGGPIRELSSGAPSSSPGTRRPGRTCFGPWDMPPGAHVFWPRHCLAVRPGVSV